VTGGTLGALVPPSRVVQLTRVESPHVWQPYPFGEEALFQCSRCRVLASDTASVAALPKDCPGEAPSLPHILRMRPDPSGTPRLACMCCTLPAAPMPWKWLCGNGTHNHN
jgi:hypothetical protein